MKKNLLSTAVAATLGLLVLAPAAHAEDGTITINGLVTASTCVINGGGASRDIAVRLPTVSKNSLAAVGATAGRTPIRISLTGCLPATGVVRAYFEPGSTTNAAGRLVADVTVASGSGATAIPASAGNVEVSLLNAAGAPIVAGAAPGSQNTTPVQMVAGTADLNYAAEYYATGVATPGPVVTRVRYTIAYE
ncbi:fimbrial protein [Variovorax sp. KBW07]|uniref:fimbrial protein n=1 Tax=Variovorax sp. KBW07 TaxID=2153358 RepID=UPI000F55B820|nr:fimbrial protein [Variovorax sp. KBW07]RQO60193.1 fimbrial protein [Variovorax sp. KBW07]